MVKLVSFSFSLLILVQSFNINLEGIAKFKILLKHANYHQKKYGDTFFDFLAEHYGDKIGEHENEHKEHSNLPFKSSHNTSSQSYIISLNSPYYDIIPPRDVEAPSDYFYLESNSIFEKPIVFHPPIFA